MVRKATWIFVLLAALLVISVSAAFAASVTRPAQALVTPQQERTTLSAPALNNVDSGSYKMTKSKSYGRGDCPFDGESAAAY